MSKNTIRLLTSFCISLICAVGTHLWYISGRSLSFNYENQTPIARLAEHKNEVQRKPLRRLIWQSLGVNDSLYSGEQIRTQANSTATIEILGTGDVIELEPSSLITLQTDDGKLQLDFLEGNLFIKSTGASDNLKLKTGDQEIALNAAELSIGKSSAGQTDIQVFKGNVQGVATSVDPFEPVSPLPYSEVFVSANDAVIWEWKRNLDPGSSVQLEIGSSRTKLSPLTDAKLEGNRIQAKLAPGEYYWRLTATNPANPSEPLKSKVYRVKVLAKKPPVPLSPGDKSVVRILDDNPVIGFRWANPGRLSNAILEIAESKDFRSGYRTLPTEERDFAEIPVQKPGTYYWRVTGYLKNNKEPLSSPIFTFTAAIDKALERPVPLSPDNGSDIKANSGSNAIHLKWKPAADAKEYKVTVLNKRTKEKKEYSTLSTQLALTDLSPGQYEWTVTSFFEDAKTDETKTQTSDTWTFTIHRLPEIQWKTADSTYYYESESPELFTEWTPPEAPVSSYRVKIRSFDDSEAPTKEEIVKTPYIKTRVDYEGHWLVQIEALDSSNNVVARTPEKRVNVQMAPLPPAPVFSEDLPNPVHASKRGNLKLSWNPLPEARSYLVELLDEKGQPLRSEQTEKTEITFRKLRPGTYLARVKAIDGAGRRGPASEARDVLVPETSDIKAPKVMKIEVK